MIYKDYQGSHFDYLGYSSVKQIHVVVLWEAPVW